VVTSASAKDGPFLGRSGEKYHSDNGTEYVSKDFSTQMAEFGAKYVHGLPYKPTTQGQVLLLSLSSHLLFDFLFLLLDLREVPQP